MSLKRMPAVVVQRQYALSDAGVTFPSLLSAGRQEVSSLWRLG